MRKNQDHMQDEKCIVIRVPGKRQFHQTLYTLYGHTLDVVDSGKYLGVTINKDLTWTKHINQTIGKASKTLG
jgi:transposase-like protein